MQKKKAKQTILNANNETYRIAERIMEDPSIISRAEEVRKAFGDDYLTAYADILDSYNEVPASLPKAVKSNEIRGRAMLRAKPEVKKRIENENYIPGVGDFEMAIATDRTNLSGDITTHEMNHYVDFLKNKSPHADANSNIFYQMSKDIDNANVRINKKDDAYYKLPTEQKACMNQLREYLFRNGDIATRSEKVSEDLLKKTLKNLKGNADYDSAVTASKYLGSTKKYTKWFNQIPILGIGTIGVNKYFINQNNYE